VVSRIANDPVRALFAQSAVYLGPQCMAFGHADASEMGYAPSQSAGKATMYAFHSSLDSRNAQYSRLFERQFANATVNNRRVDRGSVCT
jgi:hypothetical protein